MTNENKGFREHLQSALDKDIRYDRRKKLDYREIKIEQGVVSKAEGSCRVTIGNTVVIAGTKLSIEKPYPDRPEEGSFAVNAELLPLSSPDFESGPPSIESIELARVVDRSLREGEAVNFKKLLIKKAEKAWTIFIDVVTLNDDGNILDAAELAAIGALLDTKYPGVDKEGLVDYKKPGPQLQVDSMPVLVTVYKQGSSLFVDPLRQEEPFIDARLSVGTLEDGTVCAMQKGGAMPLTEDDISKMIEIGIAKGKEIRKILKGVSNAKKKR